MLLPCGTAARVSRGLAFLVIAASLCFSGEAFSAGTCEFGAIGPWLDLIARGRFQAAQARLGGWKRHPGCSNFSPEDACLVITLDNGEKEAVAPAALATVISEAVSWEEAGRKKCDPLFGPDEVGAIARRACLDRHAAGMEGVASPLGRRLLPEPLKRAVERMDRHGPRSGAPSAPRVDRMVVPSPNSTIAERNRQKAKKLAGQICDIRRQLDLVSQRIENMKRQTKFMRAEYNRRYEGALRLQKELRDANERARDLFLKTAGRSFDPAKDCFGTENQ